MKNSNNEINFLETLQMINQLEDLEDNWDDEYAEKPNKETIKRATNIVSLISTKKVDVSICQNGSIDLHWSDEKLGDLLINITQKNVLGAAYVKACK